MQMHLRIILVQHLAILKTYSMGMSGLPDIYTQSPRAKSLRTEGVYIRQTTDVHGITTM